ncbi:GroEL equatorial domain-like protein, partial [Choiromyces venosus 120613-1]
LFFLLHYSDIVAVQVFPSSFVVLLTGNVTTLRRARKTDNNRIAHAVGTTAVNRVEGINEYFLFMTKCEDPKACTILFRDPSKDILNVIKCNLQDAMAVARNIFFRRRLAPGGGTAEMAIFVRLAVISKSIEGVHHASPIRALTQLRAKQPTKEHTWGIDGDTGNIVDMKEYGVWEPETVKLRSIKTAIESAYLLLRVDEICSAKGAQQSGRAGGG